MPRAEYTPYSTVKPEGPKQVTERVDISFPHVEFSNSIGKALSQIGEGYGTVSRATREVAGAFDNLGSAFEKTGNQLWDRAIGLQDVQNQTTQTKAEIEYDKFANDEQIKFNQLQGEAASEGAYKAHLTVLEDKRKELLGKLPNQAVQKGFDLSTAKTVGRLGMQAAAHAAKETRSAFIGSSEARVDQYKDQISKTTDIKETEDLARKVHDEIYGKQAPAKGWTIDQANKAYKEQLDNAYASQINTISRTDPTAARKMLETNKDRFAQPIYDQTMEHVLMNERNIQSRNIGNEIQDSNPDAPLEEKIDRAKERAKEINPNAPLLVEDAVRSVKQKHEEHNREVADALARRKNTVEQALYGIGAPGGKMPQNRDQLFAFGEDVRKAYEGLPAKERDRYDKILERHAKGDFPETEATRYRVRDLEGMMINEAARFRDHDILSEEIPIAARTRLRNMQLQMIKEGIKLEADPKTSHALDVMRSGGILPKDLKPGSSKWNVFTGMVREGLVEQGKRQGFDKPLTEEQIRELGKGLLEKMPGSGWFGSNWSAQERYKTGADVPASVKEQMQLEYPGITEAGMLEKYQRLKIIQMYNKRTKATNGQ
jgi:hypothetical protein